MSLGLGGLGRLLQSSCRLSMPLFHNPLSTVSMRATASSTWSASLALPSMSSVSRWPWSATGFAGHCQRRFAVTNLRPKKTKYRKAFKGFFKTRSGGSIRGTTVRMGEYGLQLFEGGRLKDKQLDTVRTMVRRVLKPEKGAKVILRCFPHIPVTAKGAETRMGKGKGMVDYFATWVSEGVIVLEIVGARKEIALKALDVAAQALPLRTRVVMRNPDMIEAPRVLPYFIQKRLKDRQFIEHFHSSDPTTATALNTTSATSVGVASKASVNLSNSILNK
ncbi:hypothetical protein BASA62_003127 [Batrachochytrium salamandrivorans]|nr:hypothetical protein BASA62_003127 [Batrachochytrium salamandrivorans]